MTHRPIEGGLVVSLDGQVRRCLGPDDELTFGRARESSHHLHVGPPYPGDLELSREAAVSRCWDQLWTVSNEKGSRVLEVIIGGDRYLLVRRDAGPLSTLPVPPDGAVVRLVTRSRTYEISLEPVPFGDDSGPPAADIQLAGPSTRPPMPPPTAHDRLLLAAKFLSRRDPGHAIGDELATRRAAEASVRTIAPRAVENCVRRWKERLRTQGWQDLDGRANIDRVGHLLLATGVLRFADQLALPTVTEEELGSP